MLRRRVHVDSQYGQFPGAVVIPGANESVLFYLRRRPDERGQCTGLNLKRDLVERLDDLVAVALKYFIDTAATQGDELFAFAHDKTTLSRHGDKETGRPGDTARGRKSEDIIAKSRKPAAC